MTRRVVLILAVLTAAGAGVAYAATLNVGSWHLWGGSQTLTKSTCTVTGAAADTFVNEASTSQTNGSATTLDTIPDNGSRKWAFLRFDLSSCSLPASAGADSATVSIYLSNAPKSAFTLTLTRVASAWTNSLTWTSAQSLSYAPSATTTATAGTTSGVVVSFTVTADVDDFIKSIVANNGWRISESGTVQNATKDLTQFSSTDAAANKPQLVINYER